VRAAKPFITVNMGGLPEGVFESELFGHVRGAFTGAAGDKKGFFRSAEGGTVFLDEIGETTAALQVKLLRAVQEHEVTPVGSAEAVGFDARIIAATHKDLESEVREGRFREDLFYRLNVIEIAVPPLRERREDIPALAKHFAAKAAAKQNCPRKAVTDEAIHALSEYAWPGNIRELENVIERAFILSDSEITLADLPPAVSKNYSGTETGGIKTLEDVEREYILQTLETLGQDKSAAAAALGIDLSTLYRKLKRYEG
jgi:DNA-binding NtrC family response regulator